MKNRIELIKYFGRALQEESTLDVINCNLEAIKHGFFINPVVCNESVMRYVRNAKINVNATFYEKWEDVLSKTRLELAIDQVLHYMTTYGTGFQGEAYIPNQMTAEVPDYSVLKYIDVITEEELYSKCLKVLQSGIALKTCTMFALSDYVIDYVRETETALNIDTIKNKEAFCYIASKLKLIPVRPIDMLRVIVYSYTGSMMLIKNKDTFQQIAGRKGYISENTILLSCLENKHLRTLACIFYRYKPLFLAMRRASKANVHPVNVIRRYAKTMHKPMKPGFWQNIIAFPASYEDMEAHLPSLTVYKAIALLNELRASMHRVEDENTTKSYLIRNGKLFVDTNYQPEEFNDLWYESLEAFLMGYIKTVLTKNIEKLPSKAYRVNPLVKVAAPTSEKNFIGNYPIGTSINGAGANIIGIYWRNEWGAHDFDLHLHDTKGNHIGWNAGYYHKYDMNNPGYIYSGDMTNADPEATELIYCNKVEMPDSVLSVSMYHGRPNSMFRVFFTNEEVDTLSRNYTCNPNHIIIDAELTADERTMNIGIIKDSILYITNIASGNTRIPSKYRAELTLSLAYRLKYVIDMETLLKECGMHKAEEGEDVAVDLTAPEKDTLISLFAQE
jgi:hypothetical protein